MIETGDIIIFDDKHRLMCGDSTKENNIFKLIGNEINKTNDFIIYTDPPYNAKFNGRSGDFDIIENDDMDIIDFKIFIEKWYKTTFSIFNKNNTYIWCNNYLKHILESIDYNRWILSNKRPIIWVKNNFGMGTNYRPKYEMLMFDGKINDSIKNECDVWEIDRDFGEEYIHPTQKPVECFSRGLRNHIEKNVYDSFAGSGSSLIASIKNNKMWFGMEIDSDYCEKIIRRYYDYTLTNNIKILRGNDIIYFDDIKNGLKLLNGANKKGVVDDNVPRLF